MPSTSHSNIFPCTSQQLLLLRLLITLNNLINMFQNLLFPPNSLLLLIGILEPITLTPCCNSIGTLLRPQLLVFLSSQFIFLFFGEPGVVAVGQDVGVLSAVAGYECAGDVRVVEERVPEGFYEFGLVQFEVAEALITVRLGGEQC